MTHVAAPGVAHRSRAQAVDEETDTKNIGEVRGALWCSSGLGSSPSGGGGDSSSFMTKRARPRRSGESWRQVQGFEFGKRGRVAGEVHFIGALPSVNTRGLWPALFTRRINGFGYFSFEIKTFVSPVKPSLDCLHHSGLQRASSARHGSDSQAEMQARDRMQAWDGMRARSIGMVRMMNRGTGSLPTKAAKDWAQARKEGE
jgi:hypothetical protein